VLGELFSSPTGYLKDNSGNWMVFCSGEILEVVKLLEIYCLDFGEEIWISSFGGLWGLLQQVVWSGVPVCLRSNQVPRGCARPMWHLPGSVTHCGRTGLGWRAQQDPCAGVEHRV